MADFLLLMRRGGSRLAALDAEARSRHYEAWGGYLTWLRNTGRFVSGAPLEPSGARLSGERGRERLEGPEDMGGRVGGFIVLKAEDLDQAVRLAEDCPIFSVGGSMEIRQLTDM